MQKPKFGVAPKPPALTAEQTAYVAKGAGKDRRPTTETGEMHRLSLDVPMDVFLRFKVACTLSRKKMTPEILGFIEARTAELEAGKL